MLSPLVAPGEYDGAYYHYSVLRAIEDGFGIDEYVGDANRPMTQPKRRQRESRAGRTGVAPRAILPRPRRDFNPEASGGGS